MPAGSKTRRTSAEIAQDALDKATARVEKAQKRVEKAKEEVAAAEREVRLAERARDYAASHPDLSTPETAGEPTQPE
jgi:hypothetical protein